MNMNMKMVFGITALGIASGSVLGQSINIEWGSSDSVPPAMYAAAGLPGVWNNFQEMPGFVRESLVGLDGTLIAADIQNIGFDTIEATENLATSGDDSLMMDDCLTSFNDPVDGCLFFKNMEPGEYEVIMYSMAPDDDVLTSRVRVDQNTDGAEFVGGAWTGVYADGISYMRQHATVGNDRRLDVHSGEFRAEVRSVLNAMQIIKLDETCTGDCDSSGSVDFNDLVCELFRFGEPSFIADCDGTEFVDFNDLVCTLFAFGECD